jgi:hypothetical protein
MCLHSSQLPGPGLAEHPAEGGQMRSLFTLTITTLAVALLAACGGSSGGGFTPAVQVVPVEITAANAAVVASDALNAASVTSDIGGLVGPGVLGVPAQPGILSKLEQLPLTGVSKVLSPVFEAVVGPIIENCLVSGTITLTGNIANPLTLTAGDTINTVFVNCDDGDGQVLDGAMNMTITAFSGSVDTGLFQLGMTVLLTNLSMDDGSDVGPAEVHGGFSMMVNTLLYPVTTTAVSGDLLSLVAAGRSLTMKDFSSDSQVDEGIFPMSYTTIASGVAESSRFDGEASYQTIVPFVSSGGGYPYEGEMLITGAAGSTIRVIALDELTVRLEMDYDGDGAVDEIRDITWEEAIS